MEIIKYPSLRIVIPAYRASKTIFDCLSAIQQSATTEHFEVVVVDDGGNGNLYNMLFDFPLSIIESGDQNAAAARNLGAGSFNGDVLIFLDADVKINKNTIDLLTRPIISEVADATIGNYSNNVIDLNFFEKYKQLYLTKTYSHTTGFKENFFWTAICAVKTDIFNEMNGFNPTCPGCIGEDVEFGHRLTLHNKRIKSVPNATGKHLKQYSLVSLILNDLKKGISTFYLSLYNSVPVTDNPHVTPKAIIASLYSFFLFIIALSGISIGLKILPAFLLFLLYLWLRSEFIFLLSKQGFSFLLRAIPLMYLLDVVRIISVIAGSIVYLVKKFRRKFIISIFGE